MPRSIVEHVQEKYAAVADSDLSGDHAGVRAVAQAFGYSPEELAAIPAEANLGLSCGNPTATANLKPGEVVVDLGCGGGLDVFLAASKVGPGGKAVGIDMTPEMLDRARRNATLQGLTNVEFHQSTIDRLPLPDASADVIISNCVINLSADKDQVLREAFRVLKPGGRFAVSDVVVRGSVPAEIRRSMELWVGCVAGALEETEYLAKLSQVGFENIAIEPTRVYDIEDARAFLTNQGIDVNATAPLVANKFMGAFIRAAKPARRP